MDVRDCAEVLKDAELLGLVPPETHADMVVERARVWSFVLGDVSKDDAMDGLRKLARQDFRGYIRPDALVRVAGEMKWAKLSRVEKAKEHVLAEEEAQRLRTDPEYRAKREAAIQSARDAVR